jgi:sarcosine oxidase subunit beta
MRKTADVVIIGAGISGLAIGVHLAKKGVKDIVILEKTFPGNGATGRCGAGIRMQWGVELNCLLSKFSVEYFENVNEILKNDVDVEFWQGGYLIGAKDELEAEQFRKNVTLQNSLGIESSYLSPEEAKDVMPHLDVSHIKAATFCGRDGHLNPFKTVEAFVKAAMDLGIDIEKNTTVTGIEKTGGRVSGVKTDKGDIKAPIVVNAAGGWSKQMAELAGADLPVYSRRHQILVTEPVEPLQSAMFMGFGLNIYIQQVPHGPFIMGRGDADEPTDLRMTSSWKFLNDMAETVTTLMPRLARLKVVRQWAGLYNMTSDAQPIYDEAPEAKGFYHACGFSGHGFMLAPATGQLMSELILGETPSIDISSLGIDRFKGDMLLPLESSVV